MGGNEMNTGGEGFAGPGRLSIPSRRGISPENHPPAANPTSNSTGAAIRISFRLLRAVAGPTSAAAPSVFSAVVFALLMPFLSVGGSLPSQG
jgi:hypothetical protein